MFNTYLMNWVEYLLFGTRHISNTPPEELHTLLLRLESENIPWTHIVLNGGFTAFSFDIHGDLNTLLDYFEKNIPLDDISFKTRTVSRFWTELQRFLSRKEMEPLKPTQDDNQILQMLLSSTPENASQSYHSASFWGEIARRYINLRRPLNEIAVLPHASPQYLKRLMQLYDVTCQGKGNYWDPFNMHLIPHEEYVNAVHWQSPSLLEAFMQSQPKHALTQSIRELTRQALKQFLYCETPSFLSWPELDALVHNIRVIHSKVQEVPHPNEPPMLIDVFQRLLALSYQDHLWEKNIPITAPHNKGMTGTEQFLMTEQLVFAERQNKFIWKHINHSKFDLKQHGNIY